jgi:hypothetical protein
LGSTLLVVMRRAALAAILTVSGLLVLPPAALPQASPEASPSQPAVQRPKCGFERRPPGRDFVGIVSEDVFAGSRHYRKCTIGLQVVSGVALARQTFRWRDIEVAPGQYDWRVYDSYVATMANHGIKVLPIIFDPPRFRAKRGRRRGTYPPRRYSDLGRFGALLVQRYGPNGELWRSRPGKRRLPITSWQIWNEPNLPVYWPTGPDPADYAKLLKAASRAMKKVDPAAEIVTAGMPESKLSKQPLLEYIQGLYAAGAAEWFDTLGINPYATTAVGILKRVVEVRELMNRNGDERGKIWLTEIGWSDKGPPSTFRIGADRQAFETQETLRLLAAEGPLIGVRGVVYYSWKDSPPYAGGRDFWGLHTGLLAIDGQPKPAFAAFQAAARAIPPGPDDPPARAPSGGSKRPVSGR